VGSLFEWDDAKRQANVAKHGVDFAAIDAFDWETALIDLDTRQAEPRWVATGFIGADCMSQSTRCVESVVVSSACERPMPGRCGNVPKLNPDPTVPTPEEDAAINAGIAADPDTEELDDAWFARAQPASVVDPDLVERVRRGRGRQKSPTKEQITIRLDADITAHFRAGGPGWQTRLNNTLRRAVFGQS